MKTLVRYGDSNTYGTSPMRAFGEGPRYDHTEAWPGILRTSLGSGWSVVEEGLPGRSTVHDDPIEGAYRNGLKLLPALLESHRPIDLMTVMLGHQRPEGAVRCSGQSPHWTAAAPPAPT